MKRTPLKRKTPLRSKGPKRQTAAEKRRNNAVKASPCVACLINRQREAEYYGYAHPDIEVHHLKDGNRRRGHRFTIALCRHHHQGDPGRAASQKQAEKLYGPSYKENAKAFKEVYGTDDELLAFQNLLLNGA